MIIKIFRAGLLRTGSMSHQAHKMKLATRSFVNAKPKPALCSIKPIPSKCSIRPQVQVKLRNASSNGEFPAFHLELIASPSLSSGRNSSPSPETFPYHPTCDFPDMCPCFFSILKSDCRRQRPAPQSPENLPQSHRRHEMDPAACTDRARRSGAVSEPPIGSAASRKCNESRTLMSCIVLPL